MCCNPTNGRVDFEECLTYKTQLHGTEWIVSLSADWEQKPKKKKCFYRSNKSFFLLDSQPQAKSQFLLTFVYGYMLLPSQQIGK
jgi:hypothetical protein